MQLGSATSRNVGGAKEKRMGLQISLQNICECLFLNPFPYPKAQAPVSFTVIHIA